MVNSLTIHTCIITQKEFYASDLSRKLYLLCRHSKRVGKIRFQSQINHQPKVPLTYQNLDLFEKTLVFFELSNAHKL